MAVVPRYAAVLRRLHWGMFMLVVLAYLLIELRGYAPRGSALRTGLFQAHFLFGLALLLLIGPRLWQRIRLGAPAVTPALPGWQAWMAKLTHLALYGFLLIQPILGVLTIWADGRGIPIYLTGLEIPSPFVGNHDVHEWLGDLHSDLGNIFYWVIGLHIVAGLFHHFVRRDDTLRRML
jgi:cytochrome b561